jgi:gliding motility-associated-like protein
MVSDQSQCTTQSIITITQPTALVLSTTADSNVSCHGGSNGQASVTATGGTAAYTYSWSNGDTTSTTNNLVAGIYTVTVNDANNCTATATVTITEPLQALSASIVVDSNVSCNSGSNGQATATAAGGTAAYTYSWSNSDTTSTINNLVAGIYSVTITDNNNCTAQATVSITQPTVLVIDSVTHTIPSCIPGGDAIITVYVSGGASTYNYSINGGTAQASNIFTNNTDGNYTIEVQDANGCLVTSAINIATPGNPVISIITTTDVSIYGQATGTASITATSSTAGSLQYVLSSSANTFNNTTGNFTSLLAGTYTIVVTDSKQCSTSSTIVITQPNNLQATIDSIVHIKCFGNNIGYISISVAGGVGPFEYHWVPNTTTPITDSFATGLAAGTYSILVKDANNATVSISATITSPALLQASLLNTQNVLCYGDSSGGAIVQVQGGTAPFTYNWDNGADLDSILNTASAGTHTLGVQDAAGCADTVTVNIIQPSMLVIDSTSATIPTCVPGSDAMLSVFANGGMPNYSFSVDGNNYFGANVFTNLSANNYTVYVKDGNGCTATSTAVITNPSLPIITNTQVSHVPCNGQVGSLQVIGTSIYSSVQYVLGADSNSTGAFTNLVANTYIIQVIDSLGCQVDTTLTITEPAVLTIDTISVLHVLCAGGNTGAITVAAQGGTLPYQYSWVGSSSTVASATNLIAGIYTAQVADGNSCTASISITITQPLALVANIDSLSNLTCFANNSGSIQLSVQGGVYPYTYSWQGSSSTDSVLTNLSAGSYIATITDAHNCSSIISTTLTQPALLQFTSAVATNPSCVPGCDAIANVSVAGGTGNMQYVLINTNNDSTVQSNASFNNLCLGSYTVFVVDANSCSSSTVVNILSSSQPQIVSSSVQNPSCYGKLDGVLYSLADSGIAPYTYVLYNANNNAVIDTNSFGVFNGQGDGLYLIVVSDAKACTSTVLLALNEPDSIIVAIDSVQHLLCYGDNNGSATATATGGNGTVYNYTWSTTPQQQVATATGLVAASYTVHVSDALNCTGSTSISISSPTQVLLDSLILGNVTCNGLSNGYVNINVTGGVAGYTINLVGANINLNLPAGLVTGLGPDTYTLTASDANGCSTSTLFTITEPAQLQISSVNISNLLCNNIAQGGLVLTGLGGTAPYEYGYKIFNFTDSNTNGSFNGLSAGTYTIYISDANECSTTSVVTITQPLPLVVDSTVVKDNKCATDVNGQITTYISGGTVSGAYSYTLSGGGLSNPVLNNTGIYFNLSVGTYTLTTADDNGCSITQVVNITSNPRIVLDSVLFSTPSCHGDADGRVYALAAGGVGGFSYYFNGVPQGGFLNVGGLSSGSYVVKVIDSIGCVLDTMLVLPSVAPMAISTSVLQQNLCDNGSSVGIIQGVATGGNGTYQYSISTQWTTTGVFNNLANGMYIITARDGKGCTAAATVSVKAAGATFNLGTNVTPLVCGENRSGRIEIIPQGGTAPYTYLWQPGSIGNTSVHDSAISGSYQVLVTDSNGCQAGTTVIVEPAPCCDVWLANAFSPNAEGMNNVYKPILSGSSVEVVRFAIFDRWGNKVFEGNNPYDAWDGTYKGQAMDAETYYVLFHYKCLYDNLYYIKRSDIMLVR